MFIYLMIYWMQKYECERRKETYLGTHTTHNLKKNNSGFLNFNTFCTNHGGYICRNSNN